MRLQIDRMLAVTKPVAVCLGFAWSSGIGAIAQVPIEIPPKASGMSTNAPAPYETSPTLDTLSEGNGVRNPNRSLEQVAAAPERQAGMTQLPQSSLGSAAAARSARMPKLPSMMEMTGPNAIDAAWLKKSEAFSAFAKDSMQAPLLEASRSADVVTESPSPHSEGSIADPELCPSNEFGTIFTWTAPNFYSRPLYFEQVNMERYESKCPPWSRPVVSYAAFLGTIPIVPYKMGGARVHERAYTLGHWRPGDPTPHQIHWGPRTTRGALYQGAATTGLIFFLP